MYDARIFNFEGTLFSSQVCKACDFSVTQLRLAAEPTADGGVANLQAWATRRFVVREGWAAGRNQALFAARPAAGVADGALMLQPWLGLVGSLGRPRYKVETVNCTEKNFRVRAQWPRRQGLAPRVRHAHRPRAAGRRDRERHAREEEGHRLVWPARGSSRT